MARIYTLAVVALLAACAGGGSLEKDIEKMQAHLAKMEVALRGGLSLGVCTSDFSARDMDGGSGGSGIQPHVWPLAVTIHTYDRSHSHLSQ